MSTNETEYDGNLVDSIEIPLHFHLGDVSLTIGDLKAIQPGYIFNLNCSPTNPVVIEVNGTPLGRGELVLVDGKPAIEFKELADHGLHFS